MGRALTLDELYAPPRRFKWYRHRVLLREQPFVLSDEELKLALERDAEGLQPWQTAALLETTIGAVATAIRLHRRPAAA